MVFGQNVTIHLFPCFSFVSTSLSVALDLTSRIVAAVSALLEPGAMCAWVAFSPRPLFYYEDLVPPTPWFNPGSVIETNAVYSSRNDYYCPSAFLVRKSEPPTQRPVSETLNFPYIVLSH
jgi:hypothetical protein